MYSMASSLEPGTARLEDSCYFSDELDSDVEAFLYSQVHHLNVEETKGENDKESEEGQAENFNTILGGRKSVASRYYLRITCHFCGKTGHFAKDCPKKIPTCYLCGMKGHRRGGCPNELCFNCQEEGHKAKTCEKKKKKLYPRCARCYQHGHDHERCPDVWRQYHITTSGEDIKKPGTKSKCSSRGRFCFNCGIKGHLGHNCKRPQISRFNIPVPPFVVNYDCNKSLDCLGKKSGSVTKVNKKPAPKNRDRTFEGKQLKRSTLGIMQQEPEPKVSGKILNDAKMWISKQNENERAFVEKKNEKNNSNRKANNEPLAAVVRTPNKNVGQKKKKCSKILEPKAKQINKCLKDSQLLTRNDKLYRKEGERAVKCIGEQINTGVKNKKEAFKNVTKAKIAGPLMSDVEDNKSQIPNPMEKLKCVIAKKHKKKKKRKVIAVGKINSFDYENGSNKNYMTEFSNIGDYNSMISEEYLTPLRSHQTPAMLHGSGSLNSQSLPISDRLDENGATEKTKKVKRNRDSQENEDLRFIIKRRKNEARSIQQNDALVCPKDKKIDCIDLTSKSTLKSSKQRAQDSNETNGSLPEYFIAVQKRESFPEIERTVITGVKPEMDNTSSESRCQTFKARTNTSVSGKKDKFLEKAAVFESPTLLGHCKEDSEFVICIDGDDRRDGIQIERIGKKQPFLNGDDVSQDMRQIKQQDVCLESLSEKNDKTRYDPTQGSIADVYRRVLTKSKGKKRVPETFSNRKRRRSSFRARKYQKH